jgi:hypothetical protein
MFGNLINNNFIKELIQQKVLEITPMDNKLLQLAQYPSRGYIIHEVVAENEGNKVHLFSEKNSKFSLKPRIYYWEMYLKALNFQLEL